ncbi:MAG: acetamidase/formamidase family protein, partial [Solirubrobacteraceae bacterium]
MNDHTIHSAEHTAFVWDNSLAPALEVESGATVEFETVDASGGQLNPDSTAQDVANLDLTKVNPVTGPVFVKTAEPGDVLQVEIRELKPNTWGWTAIIPNFGLLADEFPEPWIHISAIDPSAGKVEFIDGITLPFEPFPGTIGVAPDQPGEHSVLPPTKWGGNLDVKHLRTGTTLFLPVAVQGALFSVGDTHAAMGDGEVCGTAIESAMDIAVRLT